VTSAAENSPHAVRRAPGAPEFDVLLDKHASAYPQIRLHTARSRRTVERWLAARADVNATAKTAMTPRNWPLGD